MADGRNPSGLPRQRAMRPIYGPAEADLDRRVGGQYEGMLRVRRTLLVFTIVFSILTGIVAVTRGWDSAFGMFSLMVAPLLLILVVLEMILTLVKPKNPPGAPGR